MAFFVLMTISFKSSFLTFWSPLGCHTSENLNLCTKIISCHFYGIRWFRELAGEMPTIHKHKGLLILIDIEPNKQIVMLKNFAVSLPIWSFILLCKMRTPLFRWSPSYLAAPLHYKLLHLLDGPCHTMMMKDKFPLLSFNFVLQG